MLSLSSSAESCLLIYSIASVKTEQRKVLEINGTRSSQWNTVSVNKKYTYEIRNNTTNTNQKYSNYRHSQKFSKSCWSTCHSPEFNIPIVRNIGLPNQHWRLSGMHSVGPENVYKIRNNFTNGKFMGGVSITIVEHKSKCKINTRMLRWSQKLLVLLTTKRS